MELFLQNTPSVVNIANIGEMPLHQLQGLKSSAALPLLKLDLDARLGSRLGCLVSHLSCAGSTTARSPEGQFLRNIISQLWSESMCMPCSLQDRLLHHGHNASPTRDRLGFHLGHEGACGDQFSCHQRRFRHQSGAHRLQRVPS